MSVVINAYIKGEVKPQVNNLTLCLKELEKEEKSNLKFGRRKEIVKIRAEINQIETRKAIKNTLEGINSRVTEAEEWISEMEDRIVEITATEQNKEKRMKRNEDNLRDLWDNIKCTKFTL